MCVIESELTTGEIIHVTRNVTPNPLIHDTNFIIYLHPKT